MLARLLVWCAPTTVSRITARSDSFEMDLTLDVHSELFPLSVTQRFTLALATTLNLDGTPSLPYYDQSKRRSHADDYQYVMHGKVYKYEEEKNSDKVSVYISYGGLLMCIKGEGRYLEKIDVGNNLYLLMKTIDV